MLHYLLVFVAYTALDIVWARYTITLAAKAPSAMIWAAIIPVLGGYVVIEYTQNPWLLLPVAAGAVVGTGLGMYGEQAVAALRAIWSRLLTKP